MCRLLGIYGRIDFWQEMALEFSRLAQTGKIPPEAHLAPGHKDSWGMAVSNREQTAMLAVIRQLGSAHRSACYRQAVRSMTDPPVVFLCHLRKASAHIPITLANAHPFCCNGWAFIHNGTVYQPESLPRDPSLTATSDKSDSEHFFHYLLTRLSGAGRTKDRHHRIAAAIRPLRVGYSALNCMLSDGKELFVLRRFREHEDYYTLYRYALPRGIIIASEPLASPHLDPGRWDLLPDKSLLKIHGSPPRIDVIQL